MEGSASPMRDTSQDSRAAGKGKGANTDNVPAKRRCVSTACIACRRRKSKCDGNLPSCAACSSVYHTPCIYDPSSDHRRKGAYRKDTGPARTTKNTTLQTLIHAILNYSEEEAFDLVRQIRSCENLEDVADSVINEERGLATPAAAESGRIEDDAEVDQFESELSDKFSELMLDGSRKFIGGTSNLIFLPPGSELYESSSSSNMGNESGHHNYQVSHWTDVTDDEQLISHLMTMYFTWHYPFFTTLSRDLFYRDYVRGISSQYCSSLLVNAILALGCHFSSWEGARKDPQNSATAGDHFFKEAKRLVLENDEHANAKLCTVQALALMSVREAGCGREGKGWTYSGMSFRMAFDLGLNLNVSSNGQHTLSDEEVDARRVTFWGCYLFDKCWSNYLGRQPQLTTSNSNVPAVDILPNEEAGLWAPYTDNGIGHENMQPSRIRAVASQMFKLSEISGDLLLFFYLPMSPERPPTKQVELKKLSEIHTRLEAWKKALPRELESKEEQLPQVLLMHMFYNLLLIHLYRPFLKYTRSNSPLPQNVSPRRLCTQAASTISKLLRIYKRTYGFNQICNIAVYIAHTACTIHLLSLPEKNAQKDIIHGLRSLEEMGDSWLCARRTLRILDISANKWQVPLPQDASMTFERTHARWGLWGSWDQATSPSTNSDESPAASTPQRSAAASSKTSMLETPPPTSAPKSTPSTQTPAEGVTAMTPQYQRHESSATPATISTMRTARRSVSVQLQKPDNDFIPEPTYLKPISHMYLPFQAVPLTQHEAWYDSNDQRIHTLDNSQSSPSSTEISSLTGFGSPTNLVEESQGWWSRDPSTLGFGMGNWDDAWGVSMPNTSAAAPVAPTALQQPGISGQAPSPSESLQFPVAVPNPNISEPGQDPNMYVYNSMAFQGNFQP